MVQTIERTSQPNSLHDFDELDSVGSSSTMRPSQYGELNEFNYRPVPAIAVSGLVVSLLSLIGIFVWLALPLTLVGFALCLMGFYLIRRSQGALSGTGISVAGMLISISCLAGGIGMQIYMYQTEVPDGYHRLNFVTDISDKGLVFMNGFEQAPPDVEAIDGQQVFLKGYIYQTNRYEDLSNFLFVKDNESCCFGANPATNDRVGVVMQEGKTIDYHAGKVAVAGTFRINPKFTGSSDLEPLYIIEGDIFTTRVSDF